jgi:hypothetical protein
LLTPANNIPAGFGAGLSVNIATPGGGPVCELRACIGSCPP